VLPATGKREEKKRREVTRVLIPESYGVRLLRVAGFLYSTGEVLTMTYMRGVTVPDMRGVTVPDMRGVTSRS